MNLPEIPIFTKPDIHLNILALVNVTYYKNYPDFFYIEIIPAGICKALPIEKLETLIGTLNSIKEMYNAPKND